MRIKVAAFSVVASALLMSFGVNGSAAQASGPFEFSSYRTVICTYC